MITSRRLGLLAVAALIAIALALWLSGQRPVERTTESGRLVLPELKSLLNSVTEVRIAKGDGSRATLRKGGTDWIVEERGFPADTSRVRKLLLDLSELAVVEEKTRDPESYPQLGVEDVSSPKASGTRIDVVTPGKTLSLIVGKPSGGKSSFVRLASAPVSLLASPQIMPDADAARWLDKPVIDIAEARVKEIELQPASGPAYTVARGSAQQTDFSVSKLPKGRELSGPGAANAVAGALASLTLDDVRKAAGAGTEPAHATFHTFDGLTVDVAGRKDGDRRFITLSAQSSTKETAAEAQAVDARFSGWEIEVPGYKYDALFRPLEDLLKKPEPPSKKAGGKDKSAAPPGAKKAGAAEQKPEDQGASAP
jgi:phage gpG-like protein